MTDPLHILLVEDNPDDELLVAREMRRGGLQVRTERVDTRAAFAAALDRGGWDVVIADYALPAFSGLEALVMLKERGGDVPFVLVSGTVGEQIAVESLQAGADDYLLKQNLIRLVPAITRAIREAAERRRRQAAELALQENQKQLELIYSSVSDYLILLSQAPDGWRYTSANRAFLKKLEVGGALVTADQLAGREAAEVERSVFGFDPATSARFADLRRQAVRSGAPVSAEWEVRLPAQSFVGEFTFVPTPSSAGSSPHVLISGRDVTERRRHAERENQIREQMIESQRLEALGTLAGGIAHDFNNLLTGIFGFAELAKMAGDLTDARDHCDQIIRVAERARELVGRVLTFARQRPTGRGPVRVVEVVRELVPLMRASFPKSIELDIRLADPGPLVLTESGLLHQVVLNLCTNATHAMPDGGRLEVAVQTVEVTAPVPTDLCPLAPGPHALLRVSDTGVGMSPETLRRAFEPFFTTKPPGLGTGLGLSVVHGIVAAHGGAIRVTTAVGHGTTFEVYLPIAPADGAAEPAPHQTLPAGQGECVLVVDDDPALASMAGHMLSQLGYTPVIFTDPVPAFQAFSANPDRFAAVLTDNRMPSWTGVEFARSLAEHRPNVPIVLVTAELDPDLASFHKLLRGQLLAKPYTIEQLAQTIRRSLEK
jgi:signal transduction histidine kinase